MIPDKKGQLLLKYLDELIIGAWILLVLLFLGVFFGSGEVFQVTRISAENAVNVNTFYALP